MLRKFVLAIIFFLVSLPAFAVESLLRLATTTTTANSGLMEYLVQAFTRDTGIAVHVIAVGTGKALRLGREGDVDVILVHERSAEQRFVADGYGIDRRDVMYNHFVIVGPRSDPARVAGSAAAAEALRRIHDSQTPFISRGDDSGTHRRELFLWRDARRTPGGRWYREVGQGMGKTLQIANETDAYTMTDRGTWLAYRARLDIGLLYENDAELRNPYGIIAVNPGRYPDVNYAAASRLIRWITSPAAQRLIDDFRVQGQALFIPASTSAG